MTDVHEDFSDFMKPPNPMEVARNSPSADRRAKFLARIEEPLKNGGTQQQQEKAVQLLVDTATKDAFPTCRLQAIRALETYEDPRAAKGIEAAYYNATNFVPEINGVIRQQALESLGKSRNPEAAKLLIQVARASAKEDNHFDQQLSLDERITAVRALGNFKGAEPAETLLHVMKTEKDIALRNRAHQSLQKSTGKDLPPDVQTWEQALNNNTPLMYPSDPVVVPTSGTGPFQWLKQQFTD